MWATITNICTFFPRCWTKGKQFPQRSENGRKSGRKIGWKYDDLWMAISHTCVCFVVCARAFVGLSYFALSGGIDFNFSFSWLKHSIPSSIRYKSSENCVCPANGLNSREMTGQKGFGFRFFFFGQPIRKSFFMYFPAKQKKIGMRSSAAQIKSDNHDVLKVQPLTKYKHFLSAISIHLIAF